MFVCRLEKFHKIFYFVCSYRKIEKTDFKVSSQHDESDGLYDVYKVGIIPKDEQFQTKDIECVLHIPETNYTKRKEASIFCESSCLILFFG